MKHNDLNLMSLENRLTSWWKNLDSRVKLTFFCALLWGLASHGSVLFRKFSAHDDVAFTHIVGLTFSSGRWMLGLISQLETFLTGGSHYSMPLVNGMVSILCVAVSAALVVSLLQIRSRWLCAAVGGIFVSVPVMASLFAFMFTAPYYMLALLMTVFGAWLICRKEKWYLYIGGIALMTGAMGVYQAYIPVAISMMLIHFLLELTRRDKAELSKTIRTAVRYGFAICAAVLGYYIINKCFLRLYDTQLTSYQGINKMGREGISVYLVRLVQAYECFFFPETVNGASGCFVLMGLEVPYKLLLGLTAALLLALIFRAGKKHPLLGLQMAAVAVLLPLAINFIYVMCPDVHTLMVYCQCFLFVLSACLADRLQEDKQLWIRIVCIVCCVILLLFCLVFCRYDNALYMQTTFNQERTVSYLNTLATRIRSVEGYRDDLPVTYVNWQQKYDSSLTVLSDFPYIWPYEDATDLINDAAATYFMDKWCGYYTMPVEFDHPEIADMPSYPDDGSIRIIDGVIVVKFQ